MTDDADDPDRPFRAPWQARAFGIAVAFADEHGIEWPRFQDRLVERLEAGSGAYYERWLAATERLLLEEGALDPEELERRASEFAAGDRDASEFVEGWDGEGGHGHSHDHGHDDR